MKIFDHRIDIAKTAEINQILIQLNFLFLVNIVRILVSKLRANHTPEVEQVRSVATRYIMYYSTLTERISLYYNNIIIPGSNWACGSGS